MIASDMMLISANENGLCLIGGFCVTVTDCYSPEGDAFNCGNGDSVHFFKVVLTA